MRPRVFSSLVVVVLALAVTISAQEPRRSFEVASVKPQPDDRRALSIAFGMPIVRPGGVFSATHSTVLALLIFAYDLPQDRIVGAPEWAARDLFHVDARAGSDASKEQIKLMVRQLLADRFKLAAHIEPRDMRHQALVLSRSDGSVGPSLLRIDECSAAVVNDLRRNFPERYPRPVGRGVVSSCSSRGLGDLADMLSIGSAPVVDATGLTGSFYFTIRSQWDLGGVILRRPDAEPDSNLPALSTALEEQLGLKLESRRGPVDVLVVDSVLPPTDN
jgi:uncharacterized protein (TIGR03435 family)